MSDQVVGIAVLDRTQHPPVLYILCEKSDGQRQYCDLPVFTAGEPEIRAHQWKYSVDGDTLHVTPSVNWPSWGFHNSGAWSVKYKDFGFDCGYVHAFDLFRHLNGMDVQTVPALPSL